MKKITLILFALVLSLGMYAQWNNECDFKKNEVKINLPSTVFFSHPEISYERILNTDISVGASLGVGLDKSRSSKDIIFIPYFRWFFGGNRSSMEKAGAGFFIEANSALFSADEDYSYFGTNTRLKKDKKIGAGLGLGVGWKYLSRNNWVGDICCGFGRDFVAERAYSHIGISVGKRF